MGSALDADMHDVSTIESINREQLATASDRLLLRGRVWRARSATPPARGSSPAMPYARLAEGTRTQPPVSTRLADGSQTQIPVCARLAEGTQVHGAVPAPRAHPLPPVHALRPLVLWPPVRPAATRMRRVGTVAATAAVMAIPTLVGFAIGFAAVR